MGKFHGTSRILRAPNVGIFRRQMRILGIGKAADQTRTRYLSLNSMMAMCSSAGFHSSCWLCTNDWASVGVVGCT